MIARSIARPDARLDDAGEAARALLERRSDLLAQLLRDGFLGEVGRDEAARVQVAAASLRDQAVDDLGDLFGLGRRGLDLLVLEERRRKVAQQRLAVAVGARETLLGDLVRHLPIPEL